MAGDWIKWTKGLSRRREVLGIAARLGVTPRDAAGTCMDFWEWLDDNVGTPQIDENGNACVTLGALQDDFIDTLLGAPGFANAMRDEGWIVANSAMMIVPNYTRHNGQTAKQRALTSERVRRSRGQRCNDHAVTPVTLNALPEKRREEKIVDPPIVPLDASPKKATATYGVFFEEFWSTVAVHKRKSKAEAARRYREAIRVIKGRPDVQDPHRWLLERSEAYYTSQLGKTPFCHGPAPWLHQGGYDDDPESWRRDTEVGPHEPVDIPYQEH